MKRRSKAIVKGTLTAAFAAVAGLSLFGMAAFRSGPTTNDGLENTLTSQNFSTIDKHGDPRIKAIVKQMRQTPEGEELFQYAARTGTRFKWQGRESDGAGAYSNKKIFMSTGFSDDITVLTLVHELRHHWQMTSLKGNLQQLGIRDQFRMLQMIEVDACAYTAHYVARYKDKTGKPLHTRWMIPMVYGEGVADRYAEKQRENRDYIRDAYEGCFTAIRGGYAYQDAHFNVMVEDLKLLNRSLAAAKTATDLKHIRDAFFTIADDKTRTAWFRQFFTTDLKNGTILPAIKGMTDARFMQWIATQTRSDHDPDLAAMDKAYREAGAEIGRILRDNARPAPRPGS